MLVVWLLACTGADPEPEPEEKQKEPKEIVVDTDTVIVETGSTGDTAETTTVVDCSVLPPAPISYLTIPIATEEDFDFDANGFVVYQDSVNLAGTNQAQEFRVISPNIGSDVAGIKALADGDWVVADHGTASIIRVNDQTGAQRVLLSGLSSPNGLYVSQDGLVYYSEFASNGSIGWVNPETGETGTVFPQVSYPNGISMSPDGNTLYFASNQTAVSGGAIWASDYDGDRFGMPRKVMDGPPNSLLNGITVDSCGNIYTVDYKSTGAKGQLFRTTPDGSVQEMLLELDGNGWSEFSAVHFGIGVGGWERSTIYVSNRQKIYAAPIGIEGAFHPLAP